MFTNRSFYLLIVALLIVTAVSPVGAAQAADGPEITREVRHAFSTVQHFDPMPGCELPGSTEYATGNDHLIIVDQGDSWHVTFGETFHILVVYDDPTWPNETRQGTDALHFNLTKGGTVTFSESFHDFASREDAKNFWRVDYYRTFVSTGDDIRVDREIIRNPPPCWP